MTAFDAVRAARERALTFATVVELATELI